MNTIFHSLSKKLNNSTLRIQLARIRQVFTILVFLASLIGMPPTVVRADSCSDVSLVATEDTYLSAANVTYNNGGTADLHVDLTTGTSRRTALLKWDLSSIPSNATVSTAGLSLYVTDASPLVFNLYNMRRSWVEGTSSQAASSNSTNWNTYDGVNSWGTVGAANTSSDRFDTNLWGATTSSFSSTGSKTLALNTDGVAVVQGWVSGSLSNYGLIMQNYSGSTANAVFFSSSEATTAANRPKLNIHYCVSTGPTITANGTLTAFSSQPGVPSTAQTYTVAGSSLTADISITPPSGFELSTDNTNYYSSLVLPQSGGSVPSTTIYVRLNNATEGTFDDNITHTSAGATEVDIAVSGVVSWCSDVSLVAAEDTYLSANDVTYNNGGNTVLHVDATTGTSRRTALLKWDLSSIPSSATVSSASMSLYVTDTSNIAFNLYNMKRTWVEGTSSQSASSNSANWNTYNGASSWGTVGAANTSSDRDDTNLWGATTSSFSSTGSKTEALNTDGKAVVQGWINGSLSNYGLIIQNYSSVSSSALYISSSEATTAANRPKLNIHYCVSTGPTITASATLTAFSSQPGVASAAQSYTVAGSHLTEDISINAPSGFELSTDNTNYYSSLVLPQSGGSVSTTTIYVRLNSAVEGTFSGNITHVSAGATEVDVAVSGTVMNGWIAYNDCVYIDGQISTNITTYECYTNSTTGSLKDYVSGTNLPVAVTVTTSGTVDEQTSSDQAGAESNSGTDAYNTFHNIVNPVGGARLGSASSYVDLTFTGLDPAQTYAFATTANRANSDADYVTRVTKFTISDEDAATNASTSGVTVESELSVKFSTGYNTENGYVARWTGIQPGADGDFSVRFAVDTDTYAYGPTTFMLRQEAGETPVQHTLTVGNDGNGSVTLIPTGGIYNENSIVKLTPVPNSGYQFSTWGGTNAGEPSDNGDSTWSLVMDGDKSLTASFTLLPGNHAPNQPTLVQPSDGATSVSTSPTLEVTASDPDAADALDVNFYGRADGTTAGEDFTLAVLPDMQNESQYATAMVTSQMNWIVAQQSARNIVFVTSVGDLVNTPSDATQYGNADAGYDILDAANIPYSVGPGNHDMMGGTLWANYFGTSRFSGKSYYGGSYDNYNNYYLFSASGNDFILINLQYSPTTAQLDWADARLKEYPNRRGIIEQHDILNTDNSWNNQASYTALRDNPNLFLMLSGHMHTASDGAAYVAGTGTDGHTIHVVMQDYQDFSNGNGWLRLYRFSPVDDMIYMTTYSPYTSGSITTDPDQKNLVYDMAGGPAAAYTLIGTVNDITNGYNASISWPGLSENTEYDWYTTISDGSLSTTGSTWSFTTGSSTGPTCYALTLSHTGQGADPTATPANSEGCSAGRYTEGAGISLSGASPATGWQISGWTGTNNNSSTAATNTVTMPASARTASVNYSQNQYTLTYTPGAHGSITGTSPQTVNYGASGTAVTAVPATGYHFVNWSDSSTANPRTDTNVTANISVTATFAINTYTLTYTPGAHGSITGASPQTVDYGASGTAVTAVPATGYHFVNWSDSSTANPRTDSNVTANISVTANFAINTFTLTYTPGAHGSITGVSPQTVDYGTSGTAVTAVPATGYHFVNWSDSSTANPRTDTSVTANISVTATFAINTYTLTYTPGAHGSITGASPQTVDYGASGTAVTAVPVTGYHFVNWSDSSTANPRTDTNVTANISVTATFAINTYTLTYTPGAHGSITGASPQTVDYSASGTAVTAVPVTGYHFVNWSDLSTANPRTDTNVTANISVTATFAINTYTLTYTPGANGSITGVSPQTVDYGTNGTAVTAVPATGYRFVNWSDLSTANPRTDTNVTANISVTANFAALSKYALTTAVSPTGGGTINPAAGNHTYNDGDVVVVTATAATGYTFDHWSGACTGTGTCSVTMDADKTVTANFAINTYTLTYTPGAHGSITGVSPQTVDYGASGTAVTAVPAYGYHFVNWSDLSTANPRTDTNVTANISVTATFAINIYTISGSTVAGATLSYAGDTSGSTDADASGAYSINVSSGWNGTVTPSFAGCTFNPTDETYTYVTANMTGQNFAATCSMTVKSVANNDGWVLESGESTNAGGSMDSAATTFNLGDDAANKQYRGIISFNTSTLPGNAVIDSVKLRVKKSGLVGSDPFSSMGKIAVDIKKGSFSNSPTLQKGDFQAAASQNNAALFVNTLVSGWYNRTLQSGSFGYVNPTGTTQFRLRYQTDDDNDHVADYLQIFSGNAAANSRPQLVITYHAP